MLVIFPSIKKLHFKRFPFVRRWFNNGKLAVQKLVVFLWLNVMENCWKFCKLSFRLYNWIVNSFQDSIPWIVRKQTNTYITVGSNSLTYLICPDFWTVPSSTYMFVRSSIRSFTWCTYFQWSSTKKMKKRSGLKQINMQPQENSFFW